MDAANIVVTGAHGFLGRYVARHFARSGHSVFGIGHGNWSQVEWEAWGMSGWHQADITLETLERYARTPSVIVHCAGSGSVGLSISDPLLDFERTVVTTAHVLEYVRRFAPTCRVVYPSSASVYGTVQAVPIREDCPTMPISQYGTHKLMTEQMMISHGRLFGTSAAIVRLFSVYGCGLRKQLLWDACGKLSADDSVFMGTGDEVRDWLHVDDAAELLETASRNASRECPTVNGGSGKGTTVREVLLQLGRSLEANRPVPSFSGAPRKTDPPSFIADLSGSRAWGWVPTRAWMEGVDEYARWWRGESR